MMPTTGYFTAGPFPRTRGITAGFTLRLDRRCALAILLNLFVHASINAAVGMKRILFICTGNVCRSPMAEGLMRARVPGAWKTELDISSAGTFGWDGQPASSLGVSVMKDLDIDTTNHRARVLTPELVDGADLIVVMEQAHRDEIVRISPGSEEKIVIMGALDPKRGNPDIMDPIGGDRETYARTRDEIDRLVYFLIEYIADRFGLTR